MGASVGAENIAIHVETSADNNGLASARSGVNALSQATVTATNEMVAATDRATQAETSLSAATQQSAAATTNATISRERMRELLDQTGNDLEQVAAILLQERAAQAQAAQAAEQHATTLSQEAAAATQAAAAIEQATAAERQEAAADEVATVSANELVAATEAKAAAMAQAESQMGRIPPQARTAANALSVLTQAAVAGQGGLSGIANASGALAFGVASLIPKFALLASGVGAVVTIGTLLYQVWERQAEARERLNNAISASLAKDPALEAHLQAERDAADAAADAIQREADAIARKRAQDEQRAQGIASTLEEETAAAIDRATKTDDEVAAARIIREERRREEEIRQLQIDEDEKTALILAAQESRDAQLAEIAKRAHDRQKAEDQRQANEQQQVADEAAEAFRRITLEGVEAAIKSSGTFMQVVTRTLLTPIQNHLLALAEDQIVQAAYEAAFGNFFGAAQHAGVAALAVAGARKVAAIGGLNSSGGGGGSAAAGGYGGGSTFTPQPQAQGATNVTIQFVKPTTGEVINEISYLLQRNTTLNKPIYVPATAGGLA